MRDLSNEICGAVNGVYDPFEFGFLWAGDQPSLFASNAMIRKGPANGFCYNCLSITINVCHKIIMALLADFNEVWTVECSGNVSRCISCPAEHYINHWFHGYWESN